MVTQIASSPPEIFGLKASNISSSIGWGAQGGTCSLTLVDEGDPASYTDLNTGATITGFPPAGTACGFNFRQFSFGGVLQKWVYKESLSGRLYDLVLESPAKLLDGSQVIISDFEAGYDVNGNTNILTYQVKNVWNAFAYFENYQYGGIFGGSQVNDGGMPVDKLFEALEWFGSNGTIHPRKFLPDTEIDETDRLWQLPTFGGKLAFGESEYTIGFSELKDMVLARAPYYRVKGPVQSISGIITDLCETVQIDYFIQLVAPNNGIIEKPHLEVRIVDKAQVSAGIVEQYVNSFKGQGIVVSTNYGEELQSAPTGKVLIGGPASRVVVKAVKASPTCFAVWDQIGDGTFVIGDQMNFAYGSPHAFVPVALQLPCWLPSRYQSPVVGQTVGSQAVTADKWGHTAIIPNVVDPRTGNPPPLSRTTGYDLVLKEEYSATLMELRISLAYPGNPEAAFQNWMVYKAFQLGSNYVGGDIEPNRFNYQTWYGKWYVNPFVLFEAHLGNIGAWQSLEMCSRWSYSMHAKAVENDYPSTTYLKSLQTIFASVKRVAEKFYGQVFLVDLPEEPGGLDNNLRWVDPFFRTQYEASWEISESAWANDKPIRDARFYDSDGRMQGFSAWSGSAFQSNIDWLGQGSQGEPNIDFSALGQDWGTAIGGETCCMKGGPNKDINWIGGRAYCIVNSGAPVRWWDSLTTPNYGMDVLSRLFFTNPASPFAPAGAPLDVLRGCYIDEMFGGPTNAVQIPPDMLPPNYIAVPQESNRYSWGPWYAIANVANGSSEVEFNASMTPETYGSVASMDQVGFGSVFSGLAQTEAIETGSVELAQAPEFNLGDRFAASGPYVTNLDIGIGDAGIKTTYKFSTWTPTFGKLNKYNADQIAKINKASIKFAQDTTRSQGVLAKHSFPEAFAKGNFSDDGKGGGPNGIKGEGGDGQEDPNQPVGGPFN